MSTTEAADVPALSINEVDGGVHNLSRSDTETSSCTLSPEVDGHGSGNTVVRSSGSVCAGVAVTVLAFFLFFLGLLTSDKASRFS